MITADNSAADSARVLGERVHFVGEVTQERLEQFYLHAELLVFPSLYEGFGFPPLEAMACGCPAVVARAGSLPEVCRDAALYFDPRSSADLASALLRAVGDPQLRQRLVERGRHQALRFNWDQCTRETLAVMEEALAG
jgi:glycosyltransferase involved in cell wall biosynthesis